MGMSEPGAGTDVLGMASTAVASSDGENSRVVMVKMIE
jgi:alkylation response protein AidB-like acyl-CoA dehydrogenase